MICNGVNPLVVRDLLGHTSVDMTAHYTHVNLETKRAALQNLNILPRLAQPELIGDGKSFAETICGLIKNLRIDRPICLADAVLDQDVIDFYREIETGHQPKGEHKAVTKSAPASDEDVVHTDLMQQHREKFCTKRCAMPQEDTDKPKSETASGVPEPNSEPASQEQKITSSPDIDHLLVVYHNQNSDEKHSRMTKRVNGIGFNKQDAPILTELAEEYLEKGFLTESELETVHRLIAKYHRQWS